MMLRCKTVCTGTHQNAANLGRTEVLLHDKLSPLARVLCTMATYVRACDVLTWFTWSGKCYRKLYSLRR